MLRVLKGESNDVQPCFDLIRSDAILEHCAGEKLTVENARRLAGVAASLDGTRGIPRTPAAERETVLPDGRRVVTYKWTTWTEHVKYRDASHYVAEKRKRMDGEPVREEERVAFGRSVDAYHAVQETYLADSAYFWQVGGTINGAFAQVHIKIGLEAFSYFYADAPELFVELVNFNLDRALMFHSDGCLYAVLDGLVDTGIDFLNPIEIMAGMDIRRIHGKYPGLVMSGGIDVSALLPYGKPEEIGRAVRKAIEDAEGRILVGSSTELHDGVPLENYLAMKRALPNA